MKSPVIILTGPESTGKTTLANWLGERFGIEVVPEYAREYLENQPGYVYQKDDVLKIAEKQVELELLTSLSALPFVCDTDLLTIYIWMEYRFGSVDEVVKEKLSTYGSDRYYLLCSADIPWQADPLRENPHDREVLFQKHKELLESLNLPFFVVSGGDKERLEVAENSVRKILYGSTELN